MKTIYWGQVCLIRLGLIIREIGLLASINYRLTLLKHQGVTHWLQQCQNLKFIEIIMD